ncbi:MAG: CsgG/HfaB family protein [Chitinispirillaceae bacterium]
MKYLPIILLALAFAAVSTVSAAPPTVSVLYFNNLSPEESYPNLHKTITEILITDLAADTFIVLIEREQLEKVLSEIDLGQSDLVEEKSAPETGKLLGANYLFTGSIFIHRKKITVTLKLIDSQKGAIIGSGKVTSRIREFTEFMEKISTKSAEIVAKIHPEAKPISPASTGVSFETALHFGNALDKKDRGKLKEAETLLSSILDAAPDFRPARITLEDVRERLKKLSRKHDKQIEKLKKGSMSFMDFNRVTSDYMTQMKYMDLLAFCMEMRENPPEAPPGTGMSGRELVDYYLVTAANSLRRWELVVMEGEDFLKDNTGSMYFNSVKTMVGRAASEYEKQKKNEKLVESSVENLIQKLKNTSGAEHQKLCYHIGKEFMEKQLYEKAMEYYQKIDLKIVSEFAEDETPDQVLFNLFTCYYHNFNKNNAIKIYDIIRKDYPGSPYLEGMQSIVIIFGE